MVWQKFLLAHTHFWSPVASEQPILLMPGFALAYCPAVTLVWSYMLPLVAWRYAHSQQGAENRLNRRAKPGYKTFKSSFKIKKLTATGLHFTLTAWRHACSSCLLPWWFCSTWTWSHCVQEHVICFVWQPDIWSTKGVKHMYNIIFGARLPCFTMI